MTADLCAELSEAFRHRTPRDLRRVLQHITIELARADSTRYPAIRGLLVMTHDLAVTELEHRADQDRSRLRTPTDPPL